MTRQAFVTRNRAAGNSVFKKLAVQWLNEALCFASSSVVADSFVSKIANLLQQQNVSGQLKTIHK